MSFLSALVALALWSSPARAAEVCTGAVERSGGRVL